jgi:predicted oxidoreductase (fatty acid repression mutant protein)
MHNLASSVIDGPKGRRSVYALTNESTIPDERIEELILRPPCIPQSFNSQATRIVVLLKEQQEKLRDAAREDASASVSAELFKKLYQPRITGTVTRYPHLIDENVLTRAQALFYEDTAPIKPHEEKWPMLRDQFPECMTFLSFSKAL